MATQIDLAEVAQGTGGFKIRGEAAHDGAGGSVSAAGDINGDGIADVIVGAPFNTGAGSQAGAAYVVFGTASELADPVDLADVAAGTGGFKIQAETARDWAGRSVSAAGDVNGDGIDDLIVGAPFNDDGSGPGAAYVVFGKDVDTEGGFATPVNLADVAAGTGGFKIEGEGALDEAGWSVSSLGDINDDGFADLIVGAPRNGSDYAGAAYVVFGKDVDTDGGLATPVHLADVAAGTGGFKILGEAAIDRAGWSVSSAGDVNNDGFTDLIVGASLNNGGGSNAGAAYVVFGTASAPAGPVSLADVAAGTGGFKIQGEDADGETGWSVSSAGDVNGDGFDDVIVGALRNGTDYDGAAYVVFGKASGFANPVDLDTVAAGIGGFKIQAENTGNYAGWSVSSAGDVNGDGLDDVIVGAPGNNNSAGAAYVVFGKNVDVVGGFATPVELADVAAGSGGFKIQGENAGESAGYSVSSAGDVDGDGFADLIVGAPGTSGLTGAAYVVYGFATGPTARDDSFATGENSVLTGQNVITNTVPNGADSDPQGDVLTVLQVNGSAGNVGTAVAGSSGGLFTIAANGALIFNPNGDFETLSNGQSRNTTATYTITERDGGFSTATVTVTVQGANEADIFTTGNDTRDLNAYNLAAYTNAQATRALGGNDIVQLSQTQKLGVLFEAGAGNDTLTGSSSGDQVHGDGGKDRLLGENGNDSLWGDAGDDSLNGGNGHDVLLAGDGFDYVTGGAGNDSFVFADSGTAASPEQDAVTDFAFGLVSGNKDLIDLRAFDLVDWTGSDSQITVTGSGSARTIYVDLNNDHNAANNTTQAEAIIYVNAGLGGFVRNFIISDSNPLADVLV